MEKHRWEYVKPRLTRARRLAEVVTGPPPRVTGLEIKGGCAD